MRFLWTGIFLLCNVTAYATTVLPDSFVVTPQDPYWNLRETGPANAPVTVWPTNDGDRITNADGAEVRFSQRIFPPATGVTFRIPGVINGLKVTDVQQITGNPGDPLDPGTLYISVFDNGVMSSNSLGNWLMNNGYTAPAEIFMPDFFPVGFSEVYYGVNLAELGTAGESFVTSHIFNEVLSIDASGLLAGLPMYTFSSTPLIYVPGVGWSGTPLAEGTQVQYVAFHAASVPEPGVLLLLSGGLIMMAMSRRRRCSRV